MKPKLIYALSLALLTLQSCCDFGSGKSCPESNSFGNHPNIRIEFKNFPGTNFKVTTYVVENNIIVDSSIHNAPYDSVIFITPYVKLRGADINEVQLKKFIISHNNKSDTLSHLNCTYTERVEKCLCDEITKGKYSNFSFTYKNQTQTVNTLTIDY